MEHNYSVEEILKAVSDLQTKKKDNDIKKINTDKKITQIYRKIL